MWLMIALFLVAYGWTFYHIVESIRSHKPKPPKNFLRENINRMLK